MEKVFIGLRPLGPDTVVATAKYIKKNEGEREKRRAELYSYQKARAIETRNSNSNQDIKKESNQCWALRSFATKIWEEKLFCSLK